MLFKRDIQKRAWNGKGSLTLKTLKSGEAYWIFRKRAIVDGKKKYTYVRLGSLKQLPTKEDAWAAAEYLCGSGFHTVADMIRSRHLPKGRSNLPNFSVEWFTAKMNEQEGKCAICRRQPKCLVVDHDHADGKLRGLLCSTCNAAIGMFKDSIANLLMAVSYLEQYGN